MKQKNAKLVSHSNVLDQVVEVSRLITQSEYAKKLGVTPAAVTKMIYTKRVKTVTVKGTVLVYMDQSEV